jgi:NADP-reducing hydrogenase subunit HndC
MSVPPSRAGGMRPHARTATRGLNLLDAEHPDLDAYRADGGYAALARWRQLTPAELLGRMEAAGLRGRGGAGFPTARKWRIAAEQLSVPKHVVANCYDADPHAPISRTLLERSPHQVIEGALVAAHAIGPSDVLIYVHPDADRAIQRAGDALVEAEREDLLGGTDARVVVGPGGFMGGEESALLHALEGQRPMAGQRPPYPAVSGLGLKPTVVNSGETLAAVPFVLREGPEAFRGGTKIFAVREDAGEPRLVEAELGTAVGEVLELAGVRLDGARGFHIGGPTGGILPPSAVELPLSFDKLLEADTHMGSAQIRVLPRTTCMVKFAADLFEYLARETCGICVPCRVGTKRIDGILESIYSGIGRTDDVPWLAQLATHLHDGSMCGFGITAASILRTLERYFADDVQSHLAGRCPTGTCKPVRQRRYETMVQP